MKAMPTEYDLLTSLSNDDSSSTHRDSSSRSALNFDLGLLRSFVAVVACGNFSVAGKARHLTQSAISGHIRRLETLTGQRLLERTPVGATATVMGARFYERALLILKDVDAAFAEVKADSQRPQFHIAVPEDVVDERFASALRSARAAVPNSLVTVSVAPTRDSLPELGHRFDLVFATHAAPQPEARTVRRDAVGWFGAGPKADRLQIMADAGRCLLSELMVTALKRSGHPWRLELRASSSTVLALAADPTLTGVARKDALRARSIPTRSDLPDLPDVTLSVHRARSKDPALRKLAEIMAQTMGQPCQASANEATSAQRS
ncbi:MAG: LysR family transcriptional regulator [Pseudomonadota bacterium]